MPSLLSAPLTGNWVGVIPGRPNSALGQQPDSRSVSTNMGDMYNGAVEAQGLSRAAAAGATLPTLAFDFGGAVGRTNCDAAGNCAHNLPCDLFVATGEVLGLGWGCSCLEVGTVNACWMHAASHGELFQPALEHLLGNSAHSACAAHHLHCVPWCPPGLDTWLAPSIHAQPPLACPSMQTVNTKLESGPARILTTHVGAPRPATSMCSRRVLGAV